MENPIEPCNICGDVGFKDFIMTCFNCRNVREHIYCARICLRSVPDMWLCQVCRSPYRDLHGLMLLSHSCPDKASLVSGDTSPTMKHRPQVLAFPSPKRKLRTLRLTEEDIEEKKRQRPQSLHPSVFH